MRTSTMTLSLAALAALLGLATAGCVGAVGGGEADGRTRKPKTTDDEPGTDGACEQVKTPVTIRAAADFDKLPKEGCWDLFGKLRIEGQAITSLAKLGKLASVNELELVDTGLTTIDTVQPFDVWGAIIISGNPKLTALDKIALQNADDLTTSYTIRNNAVLTSLAGVGYATAVEGELRISDNARLATIAFDELTQAASIAIVNNGVTALDLGSLSTVGRVEIAGNQALTSITGAAAAAIQGDLVLRGNKLLASLGAWSSINRVEGSLVIDDNDALASLSALATMQYVTSGVTITNNAALANIDSVSHLKGIGLSVLVTGNANLSNCAALAIDHCVQSGAVTYNSNKPNTGGNNCPDCWCE